MAFNCHFASFISTFYYQKHNDLLMVQLEKFIIIKNNCHAQTSNIQPIGCYRKYASHLQ